MPREAIRDNLPKAFIKTGNNKCRVILDCAEVFIERPKSLDRQPATWSDYKQHNTIKLPFLSSCHGGRACHRFITKDSIFYNLLEHDDIIMADIIMVVFRFKKTYFFIFVIHKYLHVHRQRFKRQNKLEIYEFMLREQLIG